MEQVKQYELLILIAIRNNVTIPTDEFYKQFGDKWSVFSDRFNDLAAEGFFIKAEQETGLYRYELTKKGKHRVMELLNERSGEISAKLAQLKQRKHFKTFSRSNTFLGITGFLTSISIRLIRKPFRERGLAEFTRNRYE